MASNTSCVAKEPVQILCKDETGQIVPWVPPDGISLRPWHFYRHRRKESPLRRLPELFSVNHFIISQARPFVIPLFGENVHRPGNEIQCGRWRIFKFIDDLLKIENRLRLQQLDIFDLLPNLAYRVLLEEYYPGSAIALLPDILFEDVKKKMFSEPTRQSVDDSILKGERGVWPSMKSVKVRCVLEVELEKAYQIMTRRLDNELLNW